MSDLRAAIQSKEDEKDAGMMHCILSLDTVL